MPETITSAQPAHQFPELSDARRTQVRELFESIAGIAEEIDTDCFNTDCCDQEAMAHLADRMRARIWVIGWMADLGASKLGGNVVNGGAEKWLLPPSYHDAVEREREALARQIGGAR
jgi:hypothetical protein